MLKVIIVGYGEMFTNLIAAALDAKCDIVGVFRNDYVKYPQIIRWLKDIFNPSKEFSYIKSYNIPEIKAKGVNTEEFRKTLLKLNPDIMLVGSWGEKFQKETFKIPKIATINAHPSLLPKYRGPNPYYWAIKNQEKTTGISFHLMDEKYDTGAILAQEEIMIYPSDTGKTLKNRMVLTARGVACELLKDLSEDVIIPLQQREDISSYYSYPDDLELDFSKTADENFAKMRAIHPWGDTYFFCKNVALIPDWNNTIVEENKTNYTEAGTVVDIDNRTKTISILCSDNKVLKLSRLKLYNKYQRIFTSIFIKQNIKVGDLI